MNDYEDLRVMYLPENAAEGQWVEVAIPKKDWSCDCGQINSGSWTDCVYCGEDKESD